MNEQIDILENIIQAVSILNNTETYLEGLTNRLSECDSLTSDYEHLIENTDLSTIDTAKLIADMKSVFEERRRDKKDMAIREYYKNNVSKLSNSGSREFLIQGIKTLLPKLDTTYKNRVLTDKEVNSLKVENKPKRGRKPKVKE